MLDEFYKELEVGDKVVFERCPTSYSDYSIATVERTTKTLIILNNGQKFRRENGEQTPRPSYMEYCYLREFTQENREKAELQRLQVKVSAFDFKKLPLDQLRVVTKIIEAAGKR